MNGADNTSTYRAIIDAISGSDLDLLDNLVASDLVDHNVVPGQPAGLVGFKYWASLARSAFPDLTATVEDTLTDNDKVAGRVSYRGTHRGDFVGVSATGVRVEFSAFHLVRFAEGLAVEWWGTADLLGALIQTGASIAPPEADDRSARPDGSVG